MNSTALPRYDKRYMTKDLLVTDVKVGVGGEILSPN